MSIKTEEISGVLKQGNFGQFLLTKDKTIIKISTYKYNWGSLADKNVTILAEIRYNSFDMPIRIKIIKLIKVEELTNAEKDHRNNCSIGSFDNAVSDCN